ncbi:MAG: hypothetical protein WCW13_03255 [archaeon]|jgi:hypothetical protein
MLRAQTTTLVLEKNPRLGTVLMVEDSIQQHSGEYRKRALWESLPKKMMYQTFQSIIAYLTYSGKIAFDSERKIAWIYNPSLVKKYLERTDLSWENENKFKNKIC